MRRLVAMTLVFTLAGCSAVEHLIATRECRAAAEAWLEANPAIEKEVGAPVSVTLAPQKGSASCGGDEQRDTCTYAFVVSGPSGSRKVSLSLHQDRGGEIVVDSATARGGEAPVNLVTGEAVVRKTVGDQKRALDEEIARRAGIPAAQ